MRDYKNIKAPRSGRTRNTRSNVKRVMVGRGPRREPSDLVAALIRIMVVVLVTGGCYLVWIGYQWAAHSQTFQVAGVDVTGARHLSKDELQNIAGTFTGQSIFKVSLDEAAQRARALPWVRDVRLYRHLPNRISMTVSERTAAAVLDCGNGRYLIDDEGVVIVKEAAAGADAQALPNVSISGCRAQPGHAVDSGALNEALVLLNEIARRGGWRASDVTVRANSAETLAVVYGGHEFRIGSGNYGEKLRRLGEILSDMQQRGLTIAYVDLRPERQAAVMTVKAPASGQRVKGNGSRSRGK
jgi:cell division protein FtsQ